MPLSGCLSSNWEIGTHTQNHQGKKSKGVECFWKRLIRHCAPPLPLENGSWRREKKNQVVLCPPSFIGYN